MATLLLRLAAPLQAWGSCSKFNIRNTEREPTKSGVIGMIAAALGIQRNEDNEKLKQLGELKFGVRVEKEGKLIKDFHMVRVAKNSYMEIEKQSDVTQRYYLCDAVFLAAVESEDIQLLKKIEDALKNPVYPLYLGRRSCPPTLPLVWGIRDGTLKETLVSEPPLIDKADAVRRIVYDVEADGVVVQDAVISFSQLHRRYGYRMKKEDLLMPAEHDPMAEL